MEPSSTGQVIGGVFCALISSILLCMVYNRAYYAIKPAEFLLSYVVGNKAQVKVKGPHFGYL